MCYDRQIDKDCELLEQEGIMDYSLLVGIHFRDISEDGDIIPARPGTASGNIHILAPCTLPLVNLNIHNHI